MKDQPQQGEGATPSTTPTTNGVPSQVTDYLDEVDKGSEEEHDILNILETNFFDSNFESQWKPVRIELIKNKHLDDEYDEKCQDLLIRGRKGKELEENYGFTVQCTAGVAAVSAVGLQTHEGSYNPLGYSRLGVYLCRHPDISMRHALVQQASDQVVRLVVCKYIRGRNTTAIPRSASAVEFIEPTQGYDSHTSALPPGVNDPLQVQYDRSQVYIYEINKLLQPSSRPRQILPFAVVTLTENGEYIPAVDAKPVLKDKVAANPRLAQIIDAINSRSGAGLDKQAGLLGSPTDAGPRGAVPSSPDPMTPTPPTLGVLVGSGSASPSTSGGQSPKLTLGSPLSSSKLSPTGLPLLDLQVLNGVGMLNGHHGGNDESFHRGPNLVMEGGRMNGESPLSAGCMDFEGNAQLQQIINRINARLQTDPKPVAPPGGQVVTTGRPPSSQGDGLLPIPLNSGANGSLLAANGNAGNSLGSSSSSLGSRPGSADSMLSGTGLAPPVSQASTPTKPAGHILPSGASFGNQGFSFLADSIDTVKGSGPGVGQGPTLAQMTAGLPMSMAHSQGLRGKPVSAGLLTRKEPLCIDYRPMFAAAAAGGMAGQGLYQGLHGQPLYSDRLAQPAISHSTPTPGLHAHPLHSAAHPLHTPYPMLGMNMGMAPHSLGPAAAHMSAAAAHPQLASLHHQSPVTLRPLNTAVKRAFPEPTATIDWDKRPKFY